MRKFDRNDPSFKISKARSDLIQIHPFLGSLALRLQTKEQTEGIDVLASDGKCLYYNPEEIRKLPQQQVMGAVGQNVLHCALGHLFRMKGRDKSLWDQACDYAANAILLKERFSLPEGRLFDSKYSDMSAEKVYDELQKQRNQQPKPTSGQNPGGGDPPPGWNFGSLIDPSSQGEDGSPAPSAAELREREKNWELAVKEAAHVARQAGKLPAFMERYLETMEPVIPWRQQLWRFLNQRRPDRVTWNKPNRRLLYTGMYLPAKRTVPTGTIVVAVDTSGSIDQEELSMFGAEINEIHRSIQPQETVVLYCDTQINRVERFTRYDEIKLSARGGGGTLFEPVFHWIEHEGMTPDALVYLTDGYANFPDRSIANYPVLWAISNDSVDPPWGEHLTLRHA